MDTATFNKVIEGQFQIARNTLVKKASEYATEDRLHNFKVTAALEQGTPIQALMGMMGKHTTSLYDMMQSGDDFSEELWAEKLGDHLNYLLLLRALICERQEELGLDRSPVLVIGEQIIEDQAPKTGEKLEKKSKTPKKSKKDDTPPGPRRKGGSSAPGSIFIDGKPVGDELSGPMVVNVSPYESSRLSASQTVAALQQSGMFSEA